MRLPRTETPISARKLCALSLTAGVFIVALRLLYFSFIGVWWVARPARPELKPPHVLLDIVSLPTEKPFTGKATLVRGYEHPEVIKSRPTRVQDVTVRPAPSRTTKLQSEKNDRKLGNDTLLMQEIWNKQSPAAYQIPEYQPKITLTGHRREVAGGLFDIVLGVPSAPRTVKSYVGDTLRALFDGVTTVEMQRTLIIVAIVAEVGQDVTSLMRDLRRSFECELREGVLNMIYIDPSAYQLEDLGSKLFKFNDTDTRTRWRSKQNLDYAALMEYAASLGRFYLHVEDDAYAARGYLTRIYADMSRPWGDYTYIRYCSLGFIGVLLSSDNARSLALFLRVFYKDLPCDWLIERWSNIQRGYSLPISRTRIQLFQHRGEYSSLAEKGKTHLEIPRFKSVAWTKDELSGNAIECYLCDRDAYNWIDMQAFEYGGRCYNAPKYIEIEERSHRVFPPKNLSVSIRNNTGKGMT